jgi:hypothetical protein
MCDDCLWTDFMFLYFIDSSNAIIKLKRVKAGFNQKDYNSESENENIKLKYESLI